MVFALVVVSCAILLGLVLGTREALERAAVPDPSGWVYFVCGEDGPVKVGMSSYEPTRQRLPELSTMSPVPLTVYYSARVDDRHVAERALHNELAPYKEHGEWYDRDAALSFADHLKERTCGTA